LELPEKVDISCSKGVFKCSNSLTMSGYDLSFIVSKKFYYMCEVNKYNNLSSKYFYYSVTRNGKTIDNIVIN